MRIKHSLFYLIATLLSIAVFFLAAEGVCRLTGAGKRIATPPLVIWNPAKDREMRAQGNLFTYDPLLFWKPKPGAQVVPFTGERINSLGLRDWEIKPKKAGEIRILCLGDSSTFGFDLPRHQAYPSRLENRLANALPNPIRVINAGVIGYSSYQGLVLLKQLLRLKPDIVTIAFGACNDFFPVALPDNEKAKLTRRFRLLDSFALTRLLRDILWSDTPGNEGPVYSRVSLPQFKQNINSMVALCRAHGAAAIIISPHRLLHIENNYLAFFQENAWYRPELFQPAGLAAYSQALEDIANAHKLPFVDIRRIFRSHPRNGADLFLDAFHPNPAGHLLIAEKIAEQVLRIRAKGDVPHAN